MTPTDPARRTTGRAAPRVGPTAREWKLYLVGVLGVVYALAWISISGPPARPEPAAAVVTTGERLQPSPVAARRAETPPPPPPPGASPTPPSPSGAAATPDTGALASGARARPRRPRRPRAAPRLVQRSVPSGALAEQQAAPSVMPPIELAPPRPALAPVPDVPLVRRSHVTRVRTRSS